MVAIGAASPSSPIQTYVGWTWVGEGKPERIKVHPECDEAWCNAADMWGYPYETGPGEHCRGCYFSSNGCECLD